MTEIDGSDLPASRLYTLIDESREFAAYFLEGQALIRDIALVHPVERGGFAYFRSVVLSIQPMIAFLKGGEQLGFYIDADDPRFQLKIEAGHHGAMRCTLLPEGFRDFPEAVRGIARFLKIVPGRPPYESVLKIEGQPLRDTVNRVLRESYQTNSSVTVSATSDQSLLLHQLPPLPGKDEYDYSLDALRARRAAIAEAVERIFLRALQQREQIVAAFKEIGFRLLADRPVHLGCSCSRNRVIEGLWSLHHRGEELFDPGQATLEIKCEYCKKAYRISRQDLEGPGGDRAPAN